MIHKSRRQFSLYTLQIHRIEKKGTTSLRIIKFVDVKDYQGAQSISKNISNAYDKTLKHRRERE